MRSLPPERPASMPWMLPACTDCPGMDRDFVRRHVSVRSGGASHGSRKTQRIFFAERRECDHKPIRLRRYNEALWGDTSEE